MKKKLIAVKSSESSLRIYYYHGQRLKGVVASVQIYKNSITKFKHDVVIRFNSRKLGSFLGNAYLEKDLEMFFYSLLKHARDS